MNKSNLLSIESILAKWPSTLDGHLHYCIGLSGGIDSVVLLDLFARLKKRQQFKLSAIHVNHGISANSDSWQDFCSKLCNDLEIPLVTARLQIQKIAGIGMENSARIARYLEYIKSGADVIILAHHQDDQIETLLSQLMRGSDMHNIAAMQEVSSKQGQQYWRPLLAYSKNQILAYAKEHKLANIEDESNYDCSYLRNFLRNKIIPELINFDPHVITKLDKALSSIQEAVLLNDQLAQEDLLVVQDNLGQIDICKFKNLQLSRQLNLLSYFIRQKKLPLPTRKQLIEFIRQALTGANYRHPKLTITKQISILRKKNKIVLENI